MSDLARRLRETRQERGMSLRQAEQATKIRSRYIEAMEAGDFSRLPDGLSARGFVRNYSRWLGLDYTQALNDFAVEHGVIAINAVEVIPDPPSRDRRPSRYTEVMPLPEAHYAGELPDEMHADLDALANSLPVINGNGRITQPDGSRHDHSSAPANGKPVIYVDQRRDYSEQNSSFKLQAPKTRSLGGIVDGISTFIPGDGLTSTQRAGQMGGAMRGAAMRKPVRFTGSPRLSNVSRPVAAVGALAVVATVVYGATRIMNPGTSDGWPSITATPITPVIKIFEKSEPVAVQTPAPVVPALPGGGMEFSLDVRERAWVRISTDGRVAYEGIAPIGADQKYTAKTNVKIETGNAGAFEAIVNGVRIGALGPRNAIAKFTYSPSGKFAVEQ